MSEWNFCPSCGNSLLGDAPTFCATCGTRLQPETSLDGPDIRMQPTATTARDAEQGQSLLEYLSYDEEPPVRVRVAMNPHATPEMLTRLSRGTVYEQMRVAENTNTPVHVLAELANHEEANVRMMVAGNPNTTYEILYALRADWDPTVRAGLASNPSVLIDVLYELADDPEEDVRAAVAAHPRLPVDLIDRFVNDTDSVRYGLGRNPEISGSILMGLASDFYSGVRAQVARNPATPVTVLSQLWKDHDPQVRRAVAESQTCLPAVLTRLGADEDDWVLEGLAANPRCPQDLLQQLVDQDLDDPYGSIRGSAAGNPSLPRPLLEQLSRDQSALPRAGVAENPAASVELLRSLAADADASVRAAVAGNPSTPPSILWDLARDPNWEVRGCVALNSGIPATSPEQPDHPSTASSDFPVVHFLTNGDIRKVPDELPYGLYRVNAWIALRDPTGKEIEQESAKVPDGMVGLLMLDERCAAVIAEIGDAILTPVSLAPVVDLLEEGLEYGVGIVGVDIPVGTYRLEDIHMATGGTVHYWSRFDALLNIIDNEYLENSGGVEVTIEPDDFAFSFMGALRPMPTSAGADQT